MGIRPALGWLALLLFATTAQAEGARELLVGSPSATPAAASVGRTRETKAKVRAPRARSIVEARAHVTRKTKAPPARVNVSLTVSAEKPKLAESPKPKRAPSSRP